MEVPNTERDLVAFALIAKGDVKAFEEVFHGYTAWLYPSLIQLLKSEAEVEEVIQEVFLKVWLHREELPLIQNPGGWVHTVASRLALERLRRRAREYKRMQMVASVGPVPEEDVAEQLDVKLLKALVREAVDRLPPSRKEVFVLSREEGLSRREIAERLGVSESTVKNQLTAALRFVQEYLEGKTGVLIPSCLMFWSVLKNL